MISGVTQQQVTVNAVQKLLVLRTAFEAIQDFYGWLSAQDDADLEALGFTANDVSAIKSAFADANELAILYGGGNLNTYTLPYNFSASQRQVIGPQ